MRNAPFLNEMVICRSFSKPADTALMVSGTDTLYLDDPSGSAYGTTISCSKHKNNSHNSKHDGTHWPKHNCNQKLACMRTLISTLSIKSRVLEPPFTTFCTSNLITLLPVLLRACVTCAVLRCIEPSSSSSWTCDTILELTGKCWKDGGKSRV